MKKTNLITRILVAATAVVIFAFSCFSFYINDIQRRVTTTSIEANIQSSGEQAVHSLANWMNGRVALTEMVGKAVERIAGALPRCLSLAFPVSLWHEITEFFSPAEGVSLSA